MLGVEFDGTELPEELLGACGRVDESKDIALRDAVGSNGERNWEREQLCARKEPPNCKHGLDICLDSNGAGLRLGRIDLR